MKLAPDKSATAAAEELDRLLKERSPATLDDAFFAADWSPLWRALSGDGWPLVGAPEDGGGVAMPLSDITAIVETWGRYLVPLPFTYTVLARRWLPHAVLPAEDRLTFPIPSDRGETASVPFKMSSTIVTVGGAAAGADPRLEVAETDVDGFAPSLPIVTVRWKERLSGPRRAELLALVSAEAVGCASSALARSIEYLSQRRAFGRPVIQFQAVRHVLADMKRDLELARTAVAWACQPGARVEEAAGHALDRCRIVTTRLISLNGGMGYTWEFGLHFYLRHVLTLEKLARVPAVG